MGANAGQRGAEGPHTAGGRPGGARSRSSDLFRRMQAATSAGVRKPAALALADGTVFFGQACGAEGEVAGEICFNTSLEGYLEVLTDPSYAGQIVAMTYPQIGNYGVSADDLQAARPALRGLVVRSLCAAPSNWRSQQDLRSWLREAGVVAIEGVDTRALVRHVRDVGAQPAVLSTVDVDAGSLRAKAAAAPSIVGVNLAATVSCDEPHEAPQPPAGHAFALRPAPASRFNVVAYDCGIKRSIIHGLARAGCAVTVVPWDTPAEAVLARRPDGVFLSNGPGDPDAVQATYAQAAKLLGNVPVFGICLGHQMLCLAAGGRMEKLKYGHRGGNQPVMNLLTGRVEVTAQNHGFGLVFSSLGPIVPELSGGAAAHEDDLRVWVRRKIAPVVQTARFGRVRLTHVNLNDGTPEGVQFLDVPAFSVQYHPEASPGPADARYLFTAFARLMEGRADCLALDSASERLAMWNFAGVPAPPGAPASAQSLVHGEAPLRSVPPNRAAAPSASPSDCAAAPPACAPRASAVPSTCVPQASAASSTSAQEKGGAHA